MEIQELSSIYARLPQARLFVDTLKKKNPHTIGIDGLHASSAPLFFSSVAGKLQKTMLFVLNDAEEAGYFYHDLTQILGEEGVLFFPSSYRRALSMLRKILPARFSVLKYWLV